VRRCHRADWAAIGMGSVVLAHDLLCLGEPRLPPARCQAERGFLSAAKPRARLS